jgi:hypothetical protein
VDDLLSSLMKDIEFAMTDGYTSLGLALLNFARNIREWQNDEYK